MRRLIWLGVAVVLAVLLWWGLRVHTPAIADDPAHPGAALASLEQIELGGDKQWILIRGRDRHAPIVLFLHGGPGNPAMYLAYAFQRPLENDFLVVQWDRRGAGKSYRGAADIPKMRVSQEISDTIELIEKLRARFGQQKVILVGHSYGSTLGALVAARRPDLVRAYVGVGQVACARQQELDLQKAWVLQQALARGDSDLVNTIHAHKPFDHESAVFGYGGGLVKGTSFMPLLMTGLRAPEYSLIDAVHVKMGIDFTHAHLKNDVYSGALMDAVPRIGVPVYFFEGRKDMTAPVSCAVEFFQRLQASRKTLVWFDNSAHFPFFEEPEKFAQAMRQVAHDTAH